MSRIPDSWPWWDTEVGVLYTLATQWMSFALKCAIMMRLPNTILIMTPRQQPAKSLNEITETRCVLGLPATLESQILLKISCWLQSVFYFWRAGGVGWTVWLIWFSLWSFSHRMQQFTRCFVRCPAVPSVADWQDLQNILVGSEVDCCDLWCNRCVLNIKCLWGVTITMFLWDVH